MLLKRNQVKVVARLYVEEHYEYPKFGVNFSVISKNQEGDTPDFLGSFEADNKLLAVTKLDINAMTDVFHCTREDQVTFFGYKLTTQREHLDIEKISLMASIMKRIHKKFLKLIDDKGNVYTISEYLPLMFEAIGVDAIWFETISEGRRLSRYHEYSYEDISELVQAAEDYHMDKNNWSLQSVA